MNVTLYEKALDQVALRYAQTLRSHGIAITPTELAAVVEMNWPKIVAEAMTIHDRVLGEQFQPASLSLKPAA